MPLDDELCYQAIHSRDARFDGRFFTAVKTTGIYCRPTCPARTPRRENVGFYACAAAAEEAGFRPCRRCHPDASPGTPEWNGVSASVSRALRLIHDGALDHGKIGHLAARVGMGPRHLTRLFRDCVGASPGALARSRRVHFAGKLLRQTRLPMSQVAGGAGFSSLRRFNDAVKNCFGESPSALRRRAEGGNPDAAAAAPVELRLNYRPPLDWKGLLAFLGPRCVAGVEEVHAGVYRRALRCGESAGIIEMEKAPDTEAVLLRVPAALTRHLMTIVERTRDVLDLRADPATIDSHLRAGGLGRYIGRRPGCRVPGAWDGLELGVRAILGQQVSVKGAVTLAGRLVAALGESVTHDSRSWRFFPTAAALAGGSLDGLGITGSRVRAIQALAAAVAAGDLSLAPHADPVITREQLLALPGIGPWTADYIAMRALRQPDAFPAGDLGLRQAVADKDGPPAVRDLAALSEPWRPWRAYAALYLWRSLAGGES